MTDDRRKLTAEQVLEAGQKLLELRPLEEVLGAALEAAASAMHAETALILLRDQSTDLLTVAAARYAGEEESRGIEQISQSIIEDVISSGQPILTESAVEDPRYSGKQSVILQHIQSAVVVPLSGLTDRHGAIYLDSRSDRGLFREENLTPLSTLATISSLAIENARRYDEARREIAYLRDHREGGGMLIGSSPIMRELYSLIDRVAPTRLPVLVTGESGTGKELVARQVHNQSDRSDGAFVALYCGNVSPELFESELFGHRKGSFTGATSDKEGLVNAAEGGSLFLDEVADIPLKLQAKLLRFLQDSEFRAVGDTVTQRANVRIIAATNKDLQREIAEERFREDLFYRLFILPVQVPPLRDRLSDVPLLVNHFLRKQVGSRGRPSGISPAALKKLMSHDWPGNVRELENTVARAVVVTSGDRIETRDIIHQDVRPGGAEEQGLTWKAAERRHILRVLSLCGGNKSRAARELGISRRYLHYRLKEWNMVDADSSKGS